MPAYLISAMLGTSVPNGDALTLADADCVFIARSALLYALGPASDALQLAAGNTVDVIGQVYSAYGAAIDGAAGGHAMTVGLEGYVNGARAFTSVGGGNNVLNAGVMAAHEAEVIGIAGSSNVIVNEGRLLGSGAASHCISIAGHTNYIENAGEMTSARDFTIEITSPGAVLPFDSNTIFNRGSISGRIDGVAISTAAHADAVINAGLIVGWVFLGAGNDYFDGRGGEVRGEIWGEAGDDFFVGSDAAETFNGGAGSDTISYAGHRSGIIFDASVGLSWDGVRQERVAGIENAIGTAFADRFFGDAADNAFDAGSDGADVVLGGGGRDTVAYLQSSRGVIVDLVAQLAFDGLQNDVLSSVENATGSAFRDQLYGDAGDNVLDPGQAGQDLVSGGGGVDTVSYASSWTAMIVDLTAQAAFDGTVADTLVSIESATGTRFGDQIFGNGLANTIAGGIGADVIFTGGGADRIVYQSLADGGDTISDFAVGLDKIVLHRAGFNDVAALVAGQNFFSGPSPAPTSAAPAFLYLTGLGVLDYDPDGTGPQSYFLLATLAGAPALQVSDLQLV